ncbi:unnamed protein product [Psylliodes chrysocephalus]|uniref:G-protein coupled receptors family 1 profile domain-containing protein n=1 Tax=Psylliodes chrysocephalus TaxID=3402493 RepID=A0A9P0GAQ6_9CUCU|nr:unnamed protein product [Psylliodes chrysocephala]
MKRVVFQKFYDGALIKICAFEKFYYCSGTEKFEKLLKLKFLDLDLTIVEKDIKRSFPEKKKKSLQHLLNQKFDLNYKESEDLKWYRTLLHGNTLPDEEGGPIVEPEVMLQFPPPTNETSLETLYRVNCTNVSTCFAANSFENSTNNETIVDVNDAEQLTDLILMGVLSVVLGLMILVTVIGNVFVIAAILLERNLQNVANYLIVSLAVADLMVACLVMPLGAVYVVNINRNLIDFFRHRVKNPKILSQNEIEALDQVICDTDSEEEVGGVRDISDESEGIETLMAFFISTVLLLIMQGDKSHNAKAGLDKFAIAVTIALLYGGRTPINLPNRGNYCVNFVRRNILRFVV